MIPFKVADTKTSDVKDTKKPETECFKDIKPDSNITPSESKDFWDKKFDSMEKDSLEDLVQDYIDDIKSKSDVPDTIPDKPIEASDLRKNTIEENALKREEFALKNVTAVVEIDGKTVMSVPMEERETYPYGGYYEVQLEEFKLREGEKLKVYCTAEDDDGRKYSCIVEQGEAMKNDYISQETAWDSNGLLTIE